MRTSQFVTRRSQSLILVLRRRLEDLQLRGYAERTVEAYVHAVAQLTRLHGIARTG